MPEAIRTHRPRRVPTPARTHAERARDTGRTLALNGAAWRRLRALVLAEEPLCPRCQAAGFLVGATEVDHIDGDASNNLRVNLQGLCRVHHSQKTGRDVQRRKSSATGRPRTDR